MLWQSSVKEVMAVKYLIINENTKVSSHVAGEITILDRQMVMIGNRTNDPVINDYSAEMT
mgnify:CR=1 FL=1